MNKNTSKSTILVISMGFLVLYLVFSWKWSVFVSLAVGMTGIISNSLSVLIEKGWMKLSHILSHIIPPVLLGAVFYLFLFPLSLVSKIFTKDPLMLSPQHKTYFIQIDKSVDKKSFEKIW
ncbi:MAG: SxtJ family membrane protein [Smithella sp.]|nr:SxtJ family membrane protein [Smithella sp.]